MLEVSPVDRLPAQELRTRGIHHLVFNTDDMKMTIDFYQDVLGIRVIQAIKVPTGTSRGNPPYENLRHYFFDMGNDSTLAFFELPKGTEKGDRNVVGAMQHCSFSVSPEAAHALIDRLKARGVEMIGPLVPAPGLVSVYFYDPNDIRLELTWRENDSEGDIHVIESCAQSREEALAELRTLNDDPVWLEKVTSGFAT